MRRLALCGGVAFMTLALAACGGKSSAVATHEAGQQSATASTDSFQDRAQDRTKDPRDLPVPQIDGKPLWAANRTHTAEENAEYQFSKNGGDFGAKSETDYVTKVHAFIEKPPHGVETLDRPNGDKLMYDPRGNVFAVVARSGAPRTMFKPRDGAAYWTQQKERQSKEAKSGQDGGAEQG